MPLVSFQADHHTVEGLRFVAKYQLFSDSQGGPWISEMLWSAKALNLIDGYEVLACFTGMDSEIQFILFTFDLAWGNGIDPYTNQTDALEYATKLANQIVNDTDAEVLWTATAQEV